MAEKILQWAGPGTSVCGGNAYIGFEVSVVDSNLRIYLIAWPGTDNLTYGGQNIQPPNGQAGNILYVGTTGQANVNKAILNITAGTFTYDLVGSVDQGKTWSSYAKYITYGALSGVDGKRYSYLCNHNGNGSAGTYVIIDIPLTQAVKGVTYTIYGKKGGFYFPQYTSNGNPVYKYICGSNLQGTIPLPTYEVSYNANGHGSAPAAQTKTAGTTLTLRSFISNVNGTTHTVTITGNANGGSWSGDNGSATWRPVYSQTHWNTKSDGTGTNYSSGGNYTSNAAATLYATWKTTNTGLTYALPTETPTKNQSVKVTFNANGGSTTKASQNGSRAMTFNGWYTAASGGTKRTTSSRVTAAETVYAQFGNGTSAYSAVTLPTAAQCTRAGYELLGWSTSSTATTATYNPGASYTPSANIVLYAVWKGLGCVFIHNGTEWEAYEIYIHNGSAWDGPYDPYIYNGSTWELYGGS